MAIQYSEFITAALQGDKNGYAKLYQATFRSNFFLSAGIVGNDEQAYLILKNVYTKAFSGLDNLANCNYFPSWVKHLTLIECRDFIEKNMGNFRQIMGDCQYDGNFITDEFIPYESIGSDEIRQRIFESINSLSAPDRMVAYLDFYCRKSSAEAAEFLGITPESNQRKLSSIKMQIKNDVDAFVGTVTPLQATEESPHILKVFAKEIKAINISQENFRKTFMQIASNTFLAPEANKNTFEENVPEQPAYAPIPSPAPAAEQKTVKEEKNDNRKKIIIGAVAAALAIILAVVLIFVFKDKPSDNGEETTQGTLEETETVPAGADEELLAAIEPYKVPYAEALLFLIEENEIIKDFRFDFGDIDADGIKDLLIFGYNHDVYTLVGVTEGKFDSSSFGDSFEFHETDDEMELFIGEESGLIIKYNDIYSANGIENTTDVSYQKGYYSDRDIVTQEFLQYQKYFDASSDSYLEQMIYLNNTTGEKNEFKSLSEFNEYKDKFLTGYKKLTSGYSIENFVESGLDLVEFLRIATKELGIGGTVTTTQSAQPISYEWKESATLNKYSDLKYFNEDTVIFAMKENGLSGLLDNKGNVLIEAEYKAFSACSYGAYGSKDGYHYAASKEGSGLNEYFIDMGTYKVTDEPHGGHGLSEEDPPAGLENLESFNNGLAAAKKNGKWGYIDNSYKAVIPFEYEAAESGDYFRNEFCRQFDGKYVPVRKNEKMGIIDKDNNVIVPFEFTDIMHGENGVYIAKKDGKWGFISLDGAQYKEPAYAKEPETTEKESENADWEEAYLEVITDDSNTNKAFSITDIDYNGTPDLIIYDRSAQTDFMYIYLNGNTSEDDCITSGGTELYKSKTDDHFGTYSNYHSGLNIIDGYGKYHLFNDEVMLNWSVSSDLVYTDHSFEETESETYTLLNSRYVDSEITKETYEEYVSDFEEEFYLVEAVFINDFNNSDKPLSDYYIE